MDPNLTKPPAAGSSPAAPASENPGLPWTTASPTFPSAPAPAPSAPSFTPPPQIPYGHTYPTAVVNPPQNPPAPPATGGSPPASTNEESPVTIIPSPKSKFPALLITSFVLLTITGFAGSYLYFRTTGQAHQDQNIIPQITPVVTETQQMNESSPSSEYKNPFDPAATGQNPFSNETAYTNPFGSDTDTPDQAYENPFDNLVSPTPAK